MPANLGTAPGNPEEIIDCATKLADIMAEQDFEDDCFKTHLEGKSMMIPPALVKLLEVSQGEAVTEKIGFSDGAASLSALQLAAKNYPGHQGIITAITRLCTVEEGLLDRLMRRLAKQNNIELPDASSFGHHHHHHHHHSHHHHHHHAGMRHPGMMNPMQVQLMKMATESLDDDKKEFVRGMQQRLMSGKPPSPEEQKQMMEIQQELMEYMAVMGPVLQQQMLEQAKEQMGSGGEKVEGGDEGAAASPEQKKAD